MHSKEALLGFDARIPIADSAHYWPHSRRERFLLRVVDPAPCSVDVTVWPSVFDSGEGIGMTHLEREGLGFTGLGLPPWTGPNHGLWDSLERLRGFLNEHSVGLTSVCFVAVSVLVSSLPKTTQEGPHRVPTFPAEIGHSWSLLGYDVADAHRLSGLANCGYSDAERDACTVRWGHGLNSRHLFDDHEGAEEFRVACDARVPEHAPFVVYGLYLLPAA